MKKRLSILLSFVLALAMVVGVMAACKTNDGVTVTIPENQKTLTLAEGDYKTITATASDGSEIEWTSSDEAVATVTDKGRVTAIKAGTATITATAKGTDVSDTCEVTVVGISMFANGLAATDGISIEMKTTLQLSIKTTDNSTAKNWTSSAPEKATVSDSGLVTGVTPGEVTITVTTTSGVSATITITITASKGYQEITPDSKEAGEWYYYTSSEGGRNTNVTTAYYDSDTEVATFNFSGNGNWFIDDIQLGHKAANGTAAGWKKVTGKITASNITTTGGGTTYYLTMHGTVVQFYEGDTTFSVYFEQTSGSDDMFIRFGGNGVLISGADFTLSDLKWAPHTEVTLVKPSFTLNGDDVAITDNSNDVYGVRAYQLGLFDEKGNIVHSQNFDISGGTLDLSATEVTEDTECTVKIRALAQPGYKDSEWSDTTTKYTVIKHDVLYELESSGESGAQQSGRWTYWAGDGGSVSETPKYSFKASTNENELTLESDYVGWAWYSVQLFRDYNQYSTGAYLALTMNINASHAGRITITGNAVDLKAGNNPIELYFNNPNGATISIQFGVNGEDPAENFPLDTHLTFVLSNVVVKEFKPEALETPSATFTAAANGNPAKIVVNDPDNDPANVSHYQVGFFNAQNVLIGTANLAEDGTFSDLAIKDGTYWLAVRAVPSKAKYSMSEWSDKITEDYVIDNGGIIYDLQFGGDVDYENNAISNPDHWYYWNDQGWLGASTEVEEAKYYEAAGGVAITYKVNSGATDNAVRLFYKNTNLTVGNSYKLTLNINADYATNIVLNGTAIALDAGNNAITVYYDETVGMGYSFEMLVAVDASTVTNNTLKLTDVTWAPYTKIVLSTPSIAVSEQGIVTITDTANTAGVGSYVAGFYQNDKLVASVEVENGKALDVSRVETGDYTLKIMAKAATNQYADSAWSAGISYHVENAGGIVYDIESDFGNDTAAANPGLWGYWADLANWTGATVNVTSAKYDNGSIIITFTSTGTSDFGLQIKYVNPDGANGYSCDVIATSDMDIQVGGGEAAVTSLKANEAKTGLSGSGATFYIQVNIKNNVSGTLTISNVRWN